MHATRHRRPKISPTSLKRSEKGVDSPRNAKTGLQTTAKRRDIFHAGDRDARSVRPTHVKALRHTSDRRETPNKRPYVSPTSETGSGKPGQNTVFPGSGQSTVHLQLYRRPHSAHGLLVVPFRTESQPSSVGSGLGLCAYEWANQSEKGTR